VTADGRFHATTSPGLDLLIARGADDIAHPGGTLGAHLRRVAARLVDHGADPDTVAAGACHAAYGTDGFPPALLTLDERELLRRAIGAAAEAHVRLYAGCDRAATYPRLGDVVVAFADRFTGTTTPLARRGLRAFAAITAANELDVAEHAGWGADERGWLHTLLAPVRDLLTAAAVADVRRTLGGDTADA
jgi:hypothetical protein